MAEAWVQATFNIELYDPTKNWPRWLRRLEGAFTLFKVPEEERVPYLLHYIGSTAFEVIYNKCAPEDPYEQEYNTLVIKLEEFYAPAPLEIAKNFRFYQRRQREEESVLQYVAVLQKLGITCNFGSYLKTALRNQFVFGIRNTRIQSRLLESKDLTFDKAMQLATSMEMSAKDTDQLQGTTTSVHVIDTKKTPKRHPPTRDYKKKAEPRSTPHGSKTIPTSASTQASHKTIRCYKG